MINPSLDSIEQKVNLIQSKLGAIDELAAKNDLEETKKEIALIKNTQNQINCEIENIKAMINDIYI
jgi:chromosome segregation ATPase